MKQVFIKRMNLLVICIFIFSLIAPVTVKAETEYDRWIFQISLSGYPSTSNAGHKANLSTYKIYKKVIYGSATDISKNDTDANGEYRYLGFNQTDQKVTNQLFLDEVKSGKPETWTYQTIDNANDSWKSIIKKPELLNYNWNEKLLGHGATTLTCSSVGSYSELLLQSYATLFSEGCVQIRHDEGAGERYATFTIPPIENSNPLRGGLTVNDIFTMNENENDVEIPLKLFANIVPTKPQYFKPTMISGLTVRLTSYQIDNGQKVTVDSNKYGVSEPTTFNVEKNTSVSFRRNDFSVQLTHTIMFEGYLAFATGFSERRNIPFKNKVTVNIKNPTFPPKAEINAKDTVYVGDEIEIAGSGEDKETPPNKLKYVWQTPKGIYLNSTYPNIGGTTKFTNEGSYTVSLTVIDENGLKDIKEKTIKVLKKGNVALNLVAENTPTVITVEMKDNIINDADKLKLIKISSEGIVNGIENSSKHIQKLELKTTQAQMDYSEGGVMDESNNKTFELTGSNSNINKDFDFNVDITNFLSDKDMLTYNQYFKVKFTAYYTDNTQDSCETILKTLISKNVTIEPKPEPINHNPTASIYAPDRVVMGNDLTITGYVNDRDGDEVTHRWSYDYALQGEMDKLTKNKIWFNEVGVKKIELEATDSFGHKGWGQKEINVLPPIPNVLLDVIGKRKINRKISLDVSKSSGCSKRYPIDWSKSKWSISPLDAQNVDNIKTLLPNTKTNFEMNLNGDYKNVDVLFKKEGRYKVKCTLYSTAGYEGYAEVILNIEPDLPPIADFATLERTVRNPLENNIATIPVVDKSTSVDGDEITKRIWLYAFDSNNDGNFDNEQWYVLDNNVWKKVNDYDIDGSYSSLKNINMKKIIDGNKKSIEIKAGHVGKYTVELIIEEDLYEDTIPEFITEDDILRAGTF